MKLQKKVFGIYLEFEIIKAFKQLCEKKCQSPSKVCKMLIQKYIEENGDVDVIKKPLSSEEKKYLSYAKSRKRRHKK